MEEAENSDIYLTGQLLIAMPGMMDERFAKTVIYMCAHTEEGAMGLVLNQSLDRLSFTELLEQMGIEDAPQRTDVPIHFGGPVEAGRGFVLHSTDYSQEATLPIDDGIGLTATAEILKAIANGEGPRRCLLALGYAGWGPGQLDSEIRANGWLQVAADQDLVFGPDLSAKWNQAIGKLGIDPGMLSDSAGHA